MPSGVLDPGAMTHPNCPRCEPLQQRLEGALQARDEALRALAEAREELNRRDLQDKWRGEQAPPPYPLEAGVALPVPLRYRMVDAVHDWAAARAPGVLRLARSLVRGGHAR